MAAAEAVFNTVELFEALMLQLPGQYMRSLRLVSKHWKEIIEASANIKSHYRNRVLAPQRWDGSDSNLPVCEKSSNIKPHPALRRLFKQEDMPSFTFMKTFEIDRKDLHSEGVVHARAEFVTIPACKQLYIHKTHPSGPGEFLDIEAGITISDLLDMGNRRDEVARQAGIRLGEQDLHLWCPYSYSLLLKEEMTELQIQNRIKTNEKS